MIDHDDSPDAGTSSGAEDDPVDHTVVSSGSRHQDAAQAREYWTAQRRAAARPRPMPTPPGDVCADDAHSDTDEGTDDSDDETKDS